MMEGDQSVHRANCSCISSSLIHAGIPATCPGQPASDALVSARRQRPAASSQHRWPSAARATMYAVLVQYCQGPSFYSASSHLGSESQLWFGLMTLTIPRWLLNPSSLLVQSLRSSRGPLACYLLALTTGI